MVKWGVSHGLRPGNMPRSKRKTIQKILCLTGPTDMHLFPVILNQPCCNFEECGSVQGTAVNKNSVGDA